MILLILLLLGLCFGSFVNALVWRLHEQSKQKTKNKKQKTELSVVHGRSMCVNCKHTLAWYDLLPVISWLTLGGKCRYCKKPISWQYPAVELITAVLFVISYQFFPYQLSATSYQLLLAIWLIILTGFMALIVYDLKWMLLPDKIVYPLLGLSILYVLVLTLTSRDTKVIVDAVMGLLSIGGLFYVLFQVSEGKWIGGGDVKLGFVLGLLAGSLVDGFLVVFIASVIGTLFSLPIMFKKNGMTKHIPFGPFLIIALIIVFLFGGDLTTWYQHQIYLV